MILLEPLIYMMRFFRSNSPENCETNIKSDGIETCSILSGGLGGFDQSLAR